MYSIQSSKSPAAIPKSRPQIPLRIHGIGIFTYMKTIKETKQIVGRYTMDPMEMYNLNINVTLLQKATHSSQQKLQGHTARDLYRAFLKKGPWLFRVVVSSIFFFHPEPWGNRIQFDEHIFQLCWFNHQLGIHMNQPVLLMEEIPNNHLECRKPCK